MQRIRCSLGLCFAALFVGSLATSGDAASSSPIISSLATNSRGSSVYSSNNPSNGVATPFTSTQTTNAQQSNPIMNGSSSDLPAVTSGLSQLSTTNEVAGLSVSTGLPATPQVAKTSSMLQATGSVNSPVTSSDLGLQPSQSIKASSSVVATSNLSQHSASAVQLSPSLVSTSTGRQLTSATHNFGVVSPDSSVNGNNGTIPGVGETQSAALPVSLSSSMVPEAVNTTSLATATGSVNLAQSSSASVAASSNSSVLTSHAARETSPVSVHGSVEISSNVNATSGLATSIQKPKTENVTSTFLAGTSVGVSQTVNISSNLSAGLSMKISETLYVTSTLTAGSPSVGNSEAANVTRASFSVDSSGGTPQAMNTTVLTSSIATVQISHVVNTVSRISQGFSVAVSHTVRDTRTPTSVQSSQLVSTSVASKGISVEVSSGTANGTSSFLAKFSTKASLAGKATTSEKAAPTSTVQSPSNITSTMKVPTSAFIRSSQGISAATISLNRPVLTSQGANATKKLEASPTSYAVSLGASDSAIAQDSSVMPLFSPPASSSAPSSQEPSMPSSRTIPPYGYIVSSYTTPCYIYYVVTKTVVPMVTANQSAQATVPTVDLGSVAMLTSYVPSVTVEHPAVTVTVSKKPPPAMSTGVQAASTSVLTSADQVAGGSRSASIAPGSSNQMASFTPVSASVGQPGPSSSLWNTGASTTAAVPRGSVASSSSVVSRISDTPSASAVPRGSIIPSTPAAVGGSVTPLASAVLGGSVTPLPSAAAGGSVTPLASAAVGGSGTPLASAAAGGSVAPLASAAAGGSVTPLASAAAGGSGTPLASAAAGGTVTPLASTAAGGSVTPLASAAAGGSVTPLPSAAAGGSVTPLPSDAAGGSVTPLPSDAAGGSVTPLPSAAAGGSVTPLPSAAAGGSVTPLPSAAAGGSVTPLASAAAGGSVAPLPSAAAGGSVTPLPSAAAGGSVTPLASAAAGGSVTPLPSTAAGGSVTPLPSAAAGGTVTPLPSAAAAGSVTPLASAVPGGSVTPLASAAAGGSVTPLPSAAAGESVTPLASAVPGGSVTPLASAAAGESVTPLPSAAAGESVTPLPSAAAGGSVTPLASAAAGGSVTPLASAAAGGSVTPLPSAAAGESVTPLASAAAGGSVTLLPSAAAGGSVTPLASAAAGGTVTPLASAAAGGTVTSLASATPSGGGARRRRRREAGSNGGPGETVGSPPNRTAMHTSNSPLTLITPMATSTVSPTADTNATVTQSVASGSQVPGASDSVNVQPSSNATVTQSVVSGSHVSTKARNSVSVQPSSNATVTQSVVSGAHVSVKASNSVSVQPSSNATVTQSVVSGSHASVKASNSVNVQPSSNATVTQSVVSGAHVSVKASNSVSVQPSSSATVTQSVVSGAHVSTKASNSVSVQPSSNATVTQSVVSGAHVSTKASNSVSVQPSSNATVTQSVVSGAHVSVKASNSVSVQPSSSATVTQSVVSGAHVSVKASNSVSVQPSSNATVTQSVVSGAHVSTKASNSVSVQPSSNATVTQSVVSGAHVSVKASNSVSVQPSSNATVTQSVVSGAHVSTKASNSVSVQPSSNATVTQSVVSGAHVSVKASNSVSVQPSSSATVTQSVVSGSHVSVKPSSKTSVFAPSVAAVSKVSNTADMLRSSIAADGTSSPSVHPTRSASTSVVSKGTPSTHVGPSRSSVRAPSLVMMSSLGVCYVITTIRLSTTTAGITPTSNSTIVQMSQTVNGSAHVFSPSVVTGSSAVVNASKVASAPAAGPSSVSVKLQVSRVSSVDAARSTSSVISPTISRVTTSASSVAPSRLGSPGPSSVEATTRPTATVRSSSAVVVKPVTSGIPSSSETARLTSEKVPVSTTTAASIPTSIPVVPTQASTTVVVATSSVAPTTLPKDVEHSLLSMEILVPIDEDVNTEIFRSNLVESLAVAFTEGQSRARRRRRASQNVKATVRTISRPHNNRTVDVRFYMAENNNNIPADDAVNTFNNLETKQLAGILGYSVIVRPSVVFKHSVVSMVIKTSSSKNISDPAVRFVLERNLAEYYQEKKDVKATAHITKFVHEPDAVTYLEFYIEVAQQDVNRSVVVDTFRVEDVNILTTAIKFQVLKEPYIPGQVQPPEKAQAKTVMYIPKGQDLKDPGFIYELSEGLARVYRLGKEKGNARRKKRATGSASATVVDVVRETDTTATVTFAIFEFGKAVDASTSTAIMNRLSPAEMSVVTPYAVKGRTEVVYPATEEPPTTTSGSVRYWIIAAVIAPVLLVIIIILLICWRWKAGAPRKKVEPEAGMKGADAMKMQPTRTTGAARSNLHGEGPSMKTTSFSSPTPYEVDEEQPVKRETSLRRKVGRTPAKKTLEIPRKRQEESEEEDEEADSVASASRQGSTENLIHAQTAARLRADPGRPPVAKKRAPSQELEDDDSESEGSEEESATETESVATTRTDQTKYSAAQVPTVAVMGEASGPPRYPPVRFRSSVHPAPSLPPLDPKATSLVGARPPHEGDSTRQKPTRQELKQKSEIERQRNKRRLRSRRRSKVLPVQDWGEPRSDRKAWDRAQHQIDDVLEPSEDGTPRKPPRRVKRPHPASVSTVATDDDSVQLQGYKQLRSPHGTLPIDEEDDRAGSASDESEIGMDETRERMHALLDDAFSLLGPLSKKLEKERANPPPLQPQIPRQFVRPPVPARFAGNQPALPEPPPPHGRATEPTPQQRSRVASRVPGHPQRFPPQFVAGVPGYPVRTPAPPLVTRDPVVVWDPAQRDRYLRQQAPPPTFSYQDASGQNVYITPVAQQRDDAGGLVWSPYAAEDAMESLYPGFSQESYPGALGTTPPKDSSFLSSLQASPFDSTYKSRNTTLDMSADRGQRGIPLGTSPQPLIRSIKDELMRLSQGPPRKTPITEI